MTDPTALTDDELARLASDLTALHAFINEPQPGRDESMHVTDYRHTAWPKLTAVLDPVKRLIRQARSPQAGGGANPSITAIDAMNQAEQSLEQYCDRGHAGQIEWNARAILRTVDGVFRRLRDDLGFPPYERGLDCPAIALPPQGDYVLVPRVPTNAMVEALAGFSLQEDEVAGWLEGYAAMLSAAPPAPVIAVVHKVGGLIPTWGPDIGPRLREFVEKDRIWPADPMSRQAVQLDIAALLNRLAHFEKAALSAAPGCPALGGGGGEPGAAEAFAALDVADRLIERGYGTDVPDEWNEAFRAVQAARAGESGS